MGDPAANRPNSPPLFHLPSSISHPSCILCTESSESFSCVLYTECSESWTAASLARMVDRVRVTKNHGQTRCCQSSNRGTHPRATGCLPPLSALQLNPVKPS